MILTPQAEEVAKSRYYAPGEDWESMCRRVATAIAQAEKPEDRNNYTKLFFEMIYNQQMIPGGRILRNAGFNRSLINCISLPIGDSIHEIGETVMNSLIVSASGGGIGIDFSPIRKKGSEIRGKGGQASGVIGWMKIIDTVNSVIETGGFRRGALLSVLNVDHPEIEEYLQAKFKDGVLSNFNISIGITKNFIEAVKNNEKWNLQFQGKIHKTINAKKLWLKIVRSMIKYAEPGIINLDYIREFHNGEYFAQFSSPNACSEQMLEKYGVCVLGSVVLPNFTTEKRIKRKELKQAIELAIRFLDDTINITNYPIEENKIAAERSRKVGLGIIGLSDLLLHHQIKYGSEESIFFIEELFKFIRDCAYEASIKLAKEKGTFPAYDSRYLDNNFIKTLPVRIRKLIEEFGMRNTCVTSCQPTGTTALLCNYSSGVEPIFSKAHWRKDKIGEEKRPYIHSIIKENNGIVPDYFVDAHDLTPEQHLLMLATIQQHVDSAVSKTINFPKGTKKEEVSDILLKYVSDLKGVTIYVDGTKKGQVLTSMTDEEIKNHLEEAEEGVVNQECSTGTCDL
jgi:ribonucleoside-diphosphate reductase alpha chain